MQKNIRESFIVGAWKSKFMVGGTHFLLQSPEVQKHFEMVFGKAKCI